jgi:hypothetical protein
MATSPSIRLRASGGESAPAIGYDAGPILPTASLTARPARLHF